MIKLYRRDADGRIAEYHEAWAEPARRRLVEHWGRVGEAGETAVHRIKFLKRLEDQFDEVLAAPRTAGFAELAEADLSLLLLDYPADAQSAWREEPARTELEDRVHEVLGWTGLGRCDGSEIEGDTLRIACFVVDAERATAVLAEALEDSEHAGYSRIAPE